MMLFLSDLDRTGNNNMTNNDIFCRILCDMANFAEKLQSCHGLRLKIVPFLETALRLLGSEKKH